MQRTFLAAAAALAFVASPSAAQMPDPAPLIAEQQAAMQKLAWLEGEWTGTARIATPEGERVLVQTEDIKAMLGGTMFLIEGRGYTPEGKLDFNAVAVMSYDPSSDSYTMTARSAGRVTSPELVVLEDGFDWTIRQGPMTIAYEARFSEGVWRETGIMTMPGRDPFKFVEMELRKNGSGN